MSNSCSSIDQSDDCQNLIALAEYFRLCNPPKYKLALKCLMGTRKLNVSLDVKVHCLFLTGKALMMYTKNAIEARLYLDAAYSTMKSMGPAFDERRLEVLCLIAEIMMEQQHYDLLKKLLKSEVQASLRYPNLNGKILIFLAEVHTKLHDDQHAIFILTTGCENFQRTNNKLLEAFLLIAKTALVSKDSKSSPADLSTLIGRICELISKLDSAWPCVLNIKCSCFVIQLCYFLSRGMIRSSKVCLKQLQTAVQCLTRPFSNNHQLANLPGAMWKFVTPEIMTAITYVLTVLSHVQFCQFDKVNKYYGTALNYIEEIRKVSRNNPYAITERGSHEFLEALEVVLQCENAQINLVLGRPLECVNVLSNMIEKLKFDTCLQDEFRFSSHMVLGMYCCMMKCYDDAENQFKESLVSSTDVDMNLFAQCNLALVYVMTNKEAEFFKIYEKIIPNKIITHSVPLKAIAFFITGLHGYIVSRIAETKTNAEQCIVIAKTEDLTRLHAMSLLLYSRAFHCLQVPILKESYEMTKRSGDNTLTIWANNQIAGKFLYKGFITNN
uniref:MAU2 chromatid cohesion factor homolog n=1 Tax=Rhabditophanes sp. KR3021 TaxID=114890 RepID=A0AC35U0M5_9BILA